MDNNMREDESGVGYLQFRVFTAGGAFPVEDAHIYVSSDNGDVVHSLTTDSGGLTRKVALAAVPKGQSLAPGNDKPYSTYNVVITKNGYRTVEDINVPIFDSVTSIQPVELIPLLEGDDGSGDITINRESAGEGL